MRINSTKHLPTAARNLFNVVADKVISTGKSELHAARVALEVVKQNYKPVNVAKSVSLKQSYESSGDNFIDVLLGKPMLDAHGEFYTADFWKNSPMKPLNGDMEHISYRKAEGLYVDHPESWEGFTTTTDRFYHKGEELWAKVELPDHPFTPTFKSNWESGKYGASVETAIPDEAIEFKWLEEKLVPHIVGGEITGFTFTEEPALDTITNEKK